LRCWRVAFCRHVVLHLSLRKRVNKYNLVNHCIRRVLECVTGLSEWSEQSEPPISAVSDEQRTSHELRKFQLT